MVYLEASQTSKIKLFAKRAIYFYTPWKCQTSKYFLTFSGGIEIKHYFPIKLNLRCLTGFWIRLWWLAKIWFYESFISQFFFHIHFISLHKISLTSNISYPLSEGVSFQANFAYVQNESLIELIAISICRNRLSR